MSWLIFIAIATIFDAARIYADNYCSDVYFKGRSAASQKVFFAYALALIAPILLAITGFDFTGFTTTSILLFLFSGVLGSIAGIPYFRALELDDSTNLGIFVQLAPVLYLILGWIFLGDTISQIQLLAFFIILSAPLLIFFTTKKRSRAIKFRAIIYSFLYVLIAVIANIIFVKENFAGANFVTEMALLFIGKSIGNFFILLTMPSWRRRFRSVVKSSKKKVFRPLLASLAFSSIKDFAYRAALILAPTVALASAISDSSAPVVIFFMGILLTLLYPKFGREKLNRKSILIHFIAIILVFIGAILIR